jgi:RNA polymerase sigma-70 factor (ECF subfamily)
MPKTEIEIFRSIQKGDITSFELLYMEMQPKMYAFSRKFIDNPEEARDVVQEVFSEFWERKTKLDIKSSLKSYLFSMLHNKCLNIIRDKKTHERYASYAELKIKEAELLHYNAAFESHSSIYLTDINTLLDKGIQDLPENCREIFILSRIKGLDNKQIADQLNLSIRTVENQIYRALKSLKENLADYLTIICLLLVTIF